jgi:hypothetical protein
MQIPEGWKVAVVRPDGTVADTVAIGGYDLEVPFAAGQLAYEVRDMVDRHVAADAERIRRTDG